MTNISEEGKNTWIKEAKRRGAGVVCAPHPRPPLSDLKNSFPTYGMCGHQELEAGCLPKRLPWTEEKGFAQGHRQEQPASSDQSVCVWGGAEWGQQPSAWERHLEKVFPGPGCPEVSAKCLLWPTGSQSAPSCSAMSQKVWRVQELTCVIPTRSSVRSCLQGSRLWHWRWPVVHPVW